MDPLLPFLEIVTAWQHQLPTIPDVTAPQPQHEDEAGWDCRIHGDRACGLPILDGWLTPDARYERMVVLFREDGTAEGYWHVDADGR